MERECRTSQVNYYATHHTSFFGEQSTEALKIALLRCLPDAGLSKIDPRDNLLIDVGANQGQNVEYFRRFGSSDSLMLMFDANPLNAALLSKKFANSNTIVFEAAVGEHNGTTVLFNLQHFANEIGNEHGSLANANVYENGLDNRIAVPIVSLDTIVPNVMKTFSKRSVRLMKIDTEGFDQLVFYGADKLLQSVGVIMWECHELQRAAKGGPGTTLLESVNFLERRGFHTFLIGPHLLRLDGYLYHPHYDVALQWQNCFSIQKSHPLRTCVDALLLPTCELA